jgi:hypothetical protein
MVVGSKLNLVALRFPGTWRLHVGMSSNEYPFLLVYSRVGTSSPTLASS